MDNEKLFMKTSDVSLVNHYYVYLLDLIGADKHPHYSNLLKYLHSKQFYWSVEMDKNRSDDGKELRYDFLREKAALGSDFWENEPCTVLEMVIALSKRISIDIMPDFEEDISYWFWILLGNLGVLKFEDRIFDANCRDEIDNILRIFMGRKYGNDGKGSLFPCEKSVLKNFSVLEIWYQMHFWLSENYNF